jgi:D-alanyl-D-alanine carboxypeptidase (penicillin-binding protein 5/6)
MIAGTDAGCTGEEPRRSRVAPVASDPLMRRVILATTLAVCLPAALSTSAVFSAEGRAYAAPRDAVGGQLLGTTGVVSAIGPGGPALPSGLDSGSWLVADADTGAVLAAKAPHVRYLPASTLKTLTAVTLLPQLDPNATAIATAGDASVDGSKVGLVPGMRYQVSTLFTAMLVVSGNDAADALAEAAGGIPHTVAMMNDEARHLQAYDTVARTPSGLDAPGESSSAYDLALIARAGLGMPDFRHYVGVVRSTVPAPHHKHFEIYTHNRLLTTYRGDIGIKNGYTVAAGATYVGAATRGGHTILITLMHANPDFWPEARALLSWGFAARDRVTPVGTLVGPAAPPTPRKEASASRPALTLSATHTGDDVPAWEIVALAASAGVLVVVTTGRFRRRRSSRLTLPPV